MADNLVQSALAKVRETASQILKPAIQATQDTRGFVQQGRFTPVQGFQQLVAPTVQKVESFIPGGFTGAQQRLQQAVQGQPIQLKSLQTGQVQPIQMPKLFDLGQQLQGFGQTVTKPVTTLTQGLQIKPPTLPPISQIPILEGFRPERVKQQIDVLNFTRSQGVDPIFLGTKPGAQGIFPQIGQQIEQTVSGFIGKAPLPFAKPVGKVAGSLVAGLVSEAPEVTAVREKLMKQQPLTEQEKNIANESITQYYLGLANPIKGVSLSQKSESILAKGFNNPQRIEEAIITEAKPIEQRLLTQGLEKDLAKTQAQNEARQLVTSRVEELKAPIQQMTQSPMQQRFELLPQDIPIAAEAKAIGAKRIAPDRVPHQQLTPEQGIQSIIDAQRNRVIRAADSWANAANDMDKLIQKYGNKMPEPTPENLIRFPTLKQDTSQFRSLSTNAPGKARLSSIKDFFVSRSEQIRSMLTPQFEQKITQDARKNYIDLVKKDISKGYRYPEEVLNYDVSFRKAITDRERYEKGLRTSFSSDDARIILEDYEVIGGGLKRQDGKEITREQINEIKNGVVDFSNTMGIDLGKLAKDDRWVYVHLNNKHPFLTPRAGGLYRKSADNASVSVGGTESFTKIVDGKKVTQNVHTTMAHELGHALDAKTNWRFFDPETVFTLTRSYKLLDEVPRYHNYWGSTEEVTARAIAQYNAIKKGNESYFTRQGFWDQNTFDQVIVPAIENALSKHFAEYRTKQPISLKPKVTTEILTKEKAQIVPVSQVAPAQAVTPTVTPAQVTPPVVIAPEPVIGKPPAISPEVPPEVAKVVSKPKVQAKLTIQPKNIDKVIQEGNAQIGRFVEPEKPMRQVLSDSYTMFVDRYNPIVKQAQKAKAFLTKEGAVLRPEFDPEYLVRRLTGAGGIADARFNQELKPIFDQIDSAGIPKIDMDTYLANKRIAGFQKAGRTIYGADPEKAGSIVSALEQKYGQKIKDIANNFYAYQNVGLKELVDSGFLSKDAENILKQSNPDYAPLYRVMDQMDDYLGVPTKKTMQGISPIQKIKGSTRLIESPTESIIANTYKQRAAIEKNNVAKAIVGLQNVMDMGFQKVSKASPETITIWNDGKKEFWKVGQDVAETAKSLNEDNVNTFLKILSYPASILRQGATGRNVEFMIPNIVRDQLDAGVTSKYGYVPFVDYTRGLWEVLKNDLNAKFGLSLDDSVYQSWANSGANIDLGQFSGKKSIQQYFDEKTAKRSLMDWISSGLDALGRYSEQPTRIGLYKKALDRTGNPLLAMMESRDATIDFARMGTKMKTANSVIPFLNVGVQGFDKLIRSIKDDPAKVAWNMTKYAALPAGTITAYNLLNHKEEYAEIPQYVKDNNFVLVKGRNAKGTVDYITIPKGNIVPLVSNPIESFMSYLANVDSRSFNELATTLITQTLPIVGDAGNIKESAIKTVGGIIPQAIKPLTENLLNVSFYKYNEKKDEAKQIVPDYLKKKPAYQQAYEWTPNLYKSIGAVLNVSPLQVQNLMEGYLAGYTKLPAQIVDGLVKLSRGESIAPKETPILRRFINETLPVQEQKPVYTPPTPSLMERITGKVGATEKTPEETNIDVIKQKLDYNPKLATPNELATYYGRDITYGQTGYKKAIEDKTFYSRLSDIESRDTLTPEQKTQAIDVMLQKNNVSRADYEYYKVAKQDTNTKTLYAQEQIANIIRSGGSDQQVFDWLANNKLQVHGQQIVTSGVLTNLVNDGVISKNQSDAVKKLEVGGTTERTTVSTKTKKLRAKKPKKVTFKKVALKKVKLPKAKAIKLTPIKPVRFARLKQPKTSRVTKLKTIKVRA